MTQSLDLPALLGSWLVHMRAENKSKQTLATYRSGVNAFLAWCERGQVDAVLDRATVNRYTASLHETGLEPATVISRQQAVRRFSAWLTEEGELDRDDLLGIKPPKLHTKVVECLTEAQIAGLLKACSGKGFADRRDEALVRFMVETGARSNETLAMAVEDVDVSAGVAVVRRGKGGKGRRVPFGPSTGRALDRYMRMRRSHRLAGTPALWLGDRGRTFSYDGLRRTLNVRSRDAGIKGFHPHILRHTAASRWLAAGGSEGGLMAVAGWSRRDMLDRYTRSTSETRAAEEARRLGLGDL